MAAATCLSVIRPVAVCLIDGLRSVTAKSGKALLELVEEEKEEEEGTEKGSWQYKAMSDGTIRKGSAMNSDKVDSNLIAGEIIDVTGMLLLKPILHCGLLLS